MWSQRPQCSRLVCTLAQLEPHAVSSGGHATVSQLPPLQRRPIGQTLPQRPQFAPSKSGLVQAPPQTVSPGEHSQAPLRHTRPPEQALPHRPQFITSNATDTHVPAHRMSPAGQAASGRHAAPLHASSLPHRRPQRPQFSKSLVTSMQTVPHSIVGVVQVPPSSGVVASGRGITTSGGISASLSTMAGASLLSVMSGMTSSIVATSSGASTGVVSMDASTLGRVMFTGASTVAGASLARMSSRWTSFFAPPSRDDEASAREVIDWVHAVAPRRARRTAMRPQKTPCGMVMESYSVCRLARSRNSIRRCRTRECQGPP